jgi:hypothetical protein
VKAKNHPPVGSDGNGPKPFHLALERVEPETWQIQIDGSSGRLQPRENVTELNQVLSDNTARVVVFIEAPQPLVTDRPDHSVP